MSWPRTSIVIAVLPRPDPARVPAGKPHQGQDPAAPYRDKAALVALIRERGDLHGQRVITAAGPACGRAALNRQLAQAGGRAAGAGQAGCHRAAAAEPGRGAGRPSVPVLSCLCTT